MAWDSCLYWLILWRVSCQFWEAPMVYAIWKSSWTLDMLGSLDDTPWRLNLCRPFSSSWCSRSYCLQFIIAWPGSMMDLLWNPQSLLKNTKNNLVTRRLKGSCLCTWQTLFVTSITWHRRKLVGKRMIFPWSHLVHWTWKCHTYRRNVESFNWRCTTKWCHWSG